MTRGAAWMLSMLLGAVLQTPPPQAPPPPKFTSSAHGVAVDVAVFAGDGVVKDLRAADFEIRDNGVLQTITAADFNMLPIDLRLVFDTSGSISDDDLARYGRTMRRVVSTLEPRDRCEIVTFNTRIAEAAARQSPPVAINVTRAGPDGTAFFDALTLAMVTVPSTDRRQITIVLSDARDNASLFDETTLVDAALLTDAVVYTILPADLLVDRTMSVERLQALSLLTGGRLIRSHEDAVASAVISAIEEFRHSYVLRYDLTGVALDGWHKLDVKVRGGRYRVRAKAGYFGR